MRGTDRTRCWCLFNAMCMCTHTDTHKHTHTQTQTNTHSACVWLICEGWYEDGGSISEQCSSLLEAEICYLDCEDPNIFWSLLLMKAPHNHKATAKTTTLASSRECLRGGQHNWVSEHVLFHCLSITRIMLEQTQEFCTASRYSLDNSQLVGTEHPGWSHNLWGLFKNLVRKRKHMEGPLQMSVHLYTEKATLFFITPKLQTIL